jgi:hypothetical protein
VEPEDGLGEEAVEGIAIGEPSRVQEGRRSRSETVANAGLKELIGKDRDRWKAPGEARLDWGVGAGIDLGRTARS